jgi:hypothetical protein
MPLSPRSPQLGSQHAGVGGNLIEVCRHRAALDQGRGNRGHKGRALPPPSVAASAGNP